MISIGTDICSIKRIEDAYLKFGERFPLKILSPEEYTVFQSLISSRKTAYLSKRFAAKEAVSKALACGIGSTLSFKDVWVLNNPDGSPYLSFSDNANALLKNKDITKTLISLSDEKEYALAFAVFS